VASEQARLPPCECSPGTPLCACASSPRALPCWLSVCGVGSDKACVFLWKMGGEEDDEGVGGSTTPTTFSPTPRSLPHLSSGTHVSLPSSARPVSVAAGASHSLVLVVEREVEASGGASPADHLASRDSSFTRVLGIGPPACLGPLDSTTSSNVHGSPGVLMPLASSLDATAVAAAGRMSGWTVEGGKVYVRGERQDDEDSTLWSPINLIVSVSIPFLATSLTLYPAGPAVATLVVSSAGADVDTDVPCTPPFSILAIDARGNTIRLPLPTLPAQLPTAESPTLADFAPLSGADSCRIVHVASGAVFGLRPRDGGDDGCGLEWLLARQLALAPAALPPFAAVAPLPGLGDGDETSVVSSTSYDCIALTSPPAIHPLSLPLTHSLSHPESAIVATVHRHAQTLAPLGDTREPTAGAVPVALTAATLLSTVLSFLSATSSFSLLSSLHSSLGNDDEAWIASQADRLSTVAGATGDGENDNADDADDALFLLPACSLQPLSSALCGSLPSARRLVLACVLAMQRRAHAGEDGCNDGCDDDDDDDGEAAGREADALAARTAAWSSLLLSAAGHDACLLDGLVDVLADEDAPVLLGNQLWHSLATTIAVQMNENANEPTTSPSPSRGDREWVETLANLRARAAARREVRLTMVPRPPHPTSTASATVPTHDAIVFTCGHAYPLVALRDHVLPEMERRLTSAAPLRGGEGCALTPGHLSALRLLYRSNSLPAACPLCVTAHRK